MWRRYIEARVSAGSLGPSLPSPGPRLTGVFVPRLLWATDEKENVGWTVYCGPRWGLGHTIAHPSVKVSPSMTCRMRSILHDIPKNAEAKSRRGGRWVKKPPAFLYWEILSHHSEHTWSAIDSITPWDILPLLKYSPWNVPSKYPNPWENTSPHPHPTACLWVGYLAHWIRCSRILFIKIHC